MVDRRDFACLPLLWSTFAPGRGSKRDSKRRTQTRPLPLARAGRTRESGFLGTSSEGSRKSSLRVRPFLRSLRFLSSFEKERNGSRSKGRWRRSARAPLQRSSRAPEVKIRIDPPCGNPSPGGEVWWGGIEGSSLPKGGSFSDRNRVRTRTFFRSNPIRSPDGRKEGDRNLPPRFDRYLFRIPYEISRIEHRDVRHREGV